MHSSHHSRGRILFDFSCTLVIVASCAGAWMQTGATALLGAAAAAGLHGLVHLTDMRFSNSTAAAEPQRIGFAAEPEGNVVAALDADETPVLATEQLAAELVELIGPIDTTVPQAKTASKAKTPRKGGSRSKTTKVANPASSEVAEVVEFAVPEKVEVAEFEVPGDSGHAHIEPLFEPEPFARMPRRAFGRRGQL